MGVGSVRDWTESAVGAVTSRSDAHQCEVCGAYAWHGFKQKNGEYLWYCLKHRLEAYKIMDLAPPPELKGQTMFDLGSPDDENHAQMRRVQNTFDWGLGLRTWIHWEMTPGEEMIGEKMAEQAARWIGECSNPAKIGAACKRMVVEGYLADTGRSEPMRNEGSHGRRSPVWRRTDKR